jgi:hypothetical protein
MHLMATLDDAHLPQVFIDERLSGSTTGVMQSVRGGSARSCQASGRGGNPSGRRDSKVVKFRIRVVGLSERSGS